MSINNFSSELPETFWWTQPPPRMEPSQKTPSPIQKTLISPFHRDDHHNHHPFTTYTHGEHPTFSFNLNREEDPEQIKEPMFEKPLTPSDVGKLNRLVIPKQHAEKYFPLGGDSGPEKGQLLSFEDELGKLWRFRYSYWNSSQSYVLTKGWSRFVKEKRLDAGDVVLFERHRLDGDRLFIGWRRRATVVPVQDSTGVVVVAQPAHMAAGNSSSGWTRVFYDAQSYPSHPSPLPIPYQPDCLHAGSIVHNQTPPSGNPKRRLRLFGVNLDCQPDDSEPPTLDGSPMSNQDQAQYQHLSTSNNYNLMDINFSRDVNQMRYHQG